MSGKGNTDDIEKGSNKICSTNSSSLNDDLHDYKVLKRRFFMQAALSVGVSIFCITMMAANSDKEGIYLPVLTGIMGYWLPSPDPRVTRARVENSKDVPVKTST